MQKNVSVELKKARLTDIAAMQQIVAPEVSSGVILERSDDEIATNIRSYTLAFLDQKLVGYAALHLHSAHLAEVRSLVVAPDLRGVGVGSAVVNELLKEARAMGLKRVLTLTYRASFFERLGFCEIPKQELPQQKIWADCIKCKHFPICNEIALIKELA